MNPEDTLGWLKKAPRGEDMPIGCKYDFSFGKPRPDQNDLPPGWEIVSHIEIDEIVEAGFGRVRHVLEELAQQGKSFLYLRNEKGKLVATWDEGRWWTAEESDTFMLMLAVPSAFSIAEAMRFSKLPRRMRRWKGR